MLLWLGLSLLSSVSKHTDIMVGFVVVIVRSLVNTISGRVMVGFVDAVVHK